MRTSNRRQGHSMSAKERKSTQEVFLQAYRSTGNIRASCLKANIDRSTIRKWEEHDLEFGFQKKEADEMVNDLIDAEIMRRAIHGDREPVVSMGRVVRDEESGEILTVTRRSDHLLMFVARARMSKYREKTQLTVTQLPKEYAFDPTIEVEKSQP